MTSVPEAEPASSVATLRSTRLMSGGTDRPRPIPTGITATTISPGRNASPETASAAIVVLIPSAIAMPPRTGRRSMRAEPTRGPSSDAPTNAAASGANATPDSIGVTPPPSCR